ncbi:pre-toxin TG domain-containing protein [Bacillus rhizoplanae]|uniref:pre-toxin TG domain-containing protein n=1 Tax=Bacillus rhizoplanae TaxID=2880966 RepID=UPI003D1A8630
MSLNMYLGEVRAQTQSMNALCVATIQGMEQAINSIDAFVFDAVLQGQTYDSAKTFFAQTFRPLAQGIIYLCEELIRQNDAFPNDFQSKVASTDVIEHEILDQIREIERTKAGIEVISSTLPGMQAMVNIFDAMKRKLQEKLEHLHEFNYTSSSNYDTALQLAASIAQGLAEVQSGKGFNAGSGTFTTQGLNMEWTASIQTIIEDKAREAEKLEYSDLIGEETINDETSSELGKEDFDGKKLARDIAGEISGEYDVRRAWEGVDPSTGEELSTWDRFLAGGMAVAGLTPVGKIAKVGKGVKMTTKAVEGVKDAERATEATKAVKGITQAEEEMITYRRVQGGTPPNASRTRITIDENGNVKIPNKKANLNVSTGNDEHAKYFLNKRGSNAEIVEFDMPKWLDDFINETAIQQKGYKSNPLNQGGTAPKIVDPTTPGNSYELPAPWIEWVEEYSKNGRVTK